MFSIFVREADIATRPCDLLVLKHADGFHGVDAKIAEKMNFRGSIPVGKSRTLPGKNTEAARVLFIGVGPLIDFGYSEIREFGRHALSLAKASSPDARRICMPIHGPGYGLDEAEAFLSLLAEIVDALESADFPAILREVEIVELNPQRARRCGILLREFLDSMEERSSNKAALNSDAFTNVAAAKEALKTFGAESKNKTRLFVAMPFREDLNDEWEISIQEAAHACELLCERIDKTAFVGDIATEIKRRIETYDGLIALLNGANPNVFLELGYAWAKGKPTILLAKDGQDLPFDVRGQRCLIYKGIADLRSKLRAELGQLKADGVFLSR